LSCPYSANHLKHYFFTWPGFPQWKQTPSPIYPKTIGAGPLYYELLYYEVLL
jgi:hypothetical protein